MASRKHTLVRAGWITTTLTVAVGALLAGTVLLAPPTAQAVHDSPYSNFELDGNPTDPVFPEATALPDDWDSVFKLPYTGPATQPVYPSPRGEPTVGDRETFVYDDGTHSQTDFGFSGKSNKDIGDVGSWLYDNSGISPDKDNIQHAYAKAYHVTVGGEDHLVIDFGADRYANAGDAALGFWFFQDHVSRDTPNRRGVGGFTGDHVDGDILVQVDFVQGGTKANKIQIFEWQGDGNGSHGTLNQLAYKEGTGDAVCTDDDTACAKTNSAAWPSPWAFTPKSGAAGIFGIQSFFEGGIDITELVGHELCFSSFMSETRTTHSETGELKDFALGVFELCSIDLVRKSCSAEAGVSPVYNAGANNFTTKHTVTIQNNGFGAVFDVALQDNAVTSLSPTSGSSCVIKSITGGVNPVDPGTGIQVPIPDSNPATDSDWVTLADALGSTPGQNTLTVVMHCTSSANPFVNTATVRAAPLTGLPPTITDNYAEVDTAVTGGPPSDVRPQCVKNLASGLTLTKACPDPVVFELVGGIYRPKVCVNITIKNDGDSIVDMVSFVDDYNDATLTNANLLLVTPAIFSTGTDGNPEIAPLDTKTYKDCYYPATPDGTPVIIDPDRVTYGDKVTASGRPHHSPSTLITATEKTASCPLCPTGLDGAPTPP
jgi:hypothetical protein